MHFFHVFTWNFQKEFFTAYLNYKIRSKWAFGKSWKLLFHVAESQQAWLKLLIIRNWSLHGSSLTLANTHGIKSSVTTGSWMKKPFRLWRKDLLDIIRFVSITFTSRTRKSFDILRTGWTTTLWMRLKSQFVRSCEHITITNQILNVRKHRDAPYCDVKNRHM